MLRKKRTEINNNNKGVFNDVIILLLRTTNMDKQVKRDTMKKNLLINVNTHTLTHRHTNRRTSKAVGLDYSLDYIRHVICIYMVICYGNKGNVSF